MDTWIIIAVIALAVGAITLKPKKRFGKTVKSSNTSGWVIGPTIRGENHSKGMPGRPTMSGESWSFEFPRQGGKVDYVQNFSPPSLVGAKAIVLRYAVTGGGFTPHEYAGSTATVSLQFQRKGDDWSGRGTYQTYRWYSRQMPALAAGEFVLTVPLELGAWGDVFGKSESVVGFDAAIQELDNIAVVFGHSSGQGHGVFATEPSRFTMLALEIVR